MDFKLILKESNEQYGLQQIDAEWLEFIKFLNIVNPKTVIEIGTCTGGSACTFSYFAKNLICVDHQNFFRNKEPIAERCTLYVVPQDSHSDFCKFNVGEVLKRNKLGKADLLFIDGDHKFKGAKNDYLYYKKLLNPDGYVVFHDILESNHHKKQNCTVFRFWQSIKTQYNNPIEIIKGRKWGGIGIIQLSALKKK